MSEGIATDKRLGLEPMDPRIASIQPGGGLCMALELAWGHCRRWYLRTFRPAYVARMQSLRQLPPRGCPYEVLDPRDLKFYRNLTGDCWLRQDDPFIWRDRLPFTRAGLAELLVGSVTCFAMAVLFAFVFWPVAVVFAAGVVLIIAFFRDPRRVTPSGPGLVVAPADGRIVSVEEIAHDDFIGGPAVVIGIFLSIFNVHINRSPVAARVIGLTYSPGKFLNALRPESARENEQLAVRLEQTAAPHRRLVVRQIAGAIARRIVCWVGPGERLERGAQFGMIKLGSRTELVLPRDESLVIQTQPGEKVKAGASVLARYGGPI